MKLADYLHLVDKRSDAFAKEIGVDGSTVRKYLRGDRRPEWDVMARIVAVTAGAVTADDFLTKPKPRRDQPIENKVA